MLIVMSKSRDKQPLEPLDDHPLIDGIDGWLDWMGSPEGQLSIEASCTLSELMEKKNVQLDAQRRELLWPKGERLSLERSAERIQRDYPRFPRPRIESFLISWLEHYAPDGSSQEQLDKLDRLVEQWLDDLERQPKPHPERLRTRDS